MKLTNALVHLVKNPFYILMHFLGWFSIYALMVILTSPQNILMYLKEGLLLITVLGCITSYREVRGYLSGAARTQKVWWNWYNIHTDTSDQGKELGDPPQLDSIHVHSLFDKIKAIMQSMYREPVPLLVHFFVWSLASVTGIYLDGPMQADIMGGAGVNHIFDELISEYWSILPVTILITVLTSLQEVRGFIDGKTTKHIECTTWYNQQVDKHAGHDLSVIPSVLTTPQNMRYNTSSLGIQTSQFIIGIFLYTCITMILGDIGIVENPNFFINFISIAMFFAI